MKKTFAFVLFCSVLVVTDALSAVATRGSGVARTRGGAAGQSVTTQSTNGAAATTTVRRAARAAVTQSQPAAQPQRVNARAATTQKAVNSGTKIVGATTNTVVSEACKTKYFGCMDSFCMLDNANGGRCLCSNRHTELDKVLDEIQKLDEQSYAMATTGVERINMGADADAVQSMVDKITGDIQNPNTKNTRARTLNLDAWNNIYETDDMDVFGDASTDIANQTGDALHASVSDMCVKQMPECSREMSMLKLMYGQQIKSDCTAYENSLKQQRNAAAKKLQTAQTALREAALEQHQNANKYDLGQCTIRFKQCMQSTAGCGEDFANCASVVGSENAQTRVGAKSKSKTYTIKTGMTSISIAASTYDILTSKKPMCDTVTNQCTSVRDQVWDTFLREVAPTLKSAELVAESNVRMNCIANISSCFQTACKDNMDPNDPDGSYDMCLSRPQTMRSLCKVQIDPCIAAEPQILDYVYARLASMRVDACTTEVKECLQSDDRCGSDYSKCIGLDTDTIINMCPSDKLTACNVDSAGKTLAQSEVYDNIENIISGIMLDIDNSMLVQCQNALNESMIKVCGDTESCDNLVLDENSGARSLKYEVCKIQSVNQTTGEIQWQNGCVSSVDALSKSMLANDSWAGKLSGVIYWDKISYDENGKFTPVAEYRNALGVRANSADAKIIQDQVFDKEITMLQTAVDNAMRAVESDPKVQFCITGRQVQGRGEKMIGRAGNARFPNLTQSVRQTITATVLKKARDNYMKKYDEEVSRMMQEQIAAAKKMDANAALNTAREQCVGWAENSGTPMAKTAADNTWKYVGAGLLAAAAIALVPFTGGGSALLLAGTLSTTGGIVAGATAGAAAVALTTTAVVNDARGGAKVDDNSGGSEGHYEIDQWNYKATINTMFNEQTGVCTKETVSRECTKQKSGNKCKAWGENKTTTQTVQLL
ncbi:MAG: hypothetical protein ACLRFM_01970 [Alphaproteobacteria bacterium]